MTVTHLKIAKKFTSKSRAILFHGHCIDLMRSMPDKSAQLVITSPPYNLGKEYEKKVDIGAYIEEQSTIIQECVRILSDTGSLCWQVGNYVSSGHIIPLDSILFPVFQSHNLVMRNRVIWHFEHGLHCSRRFSGRYETVMWFTRNIKDYVFNLDPVRVPQKYPAKKHFRGPKSGQYSCNPLGKNPGDVWDIPNVKSNHIEKTSHPCQFPVELVERFVLSVTNKNDLVFDPFVGTGTSIIAALRHNRRGAGAEIKDSYVDIAQNRIQQHIEGTLQTRPMNKPKYDPKIHNNKLTVPPWEQEIRPNLFEQ